MKYLSTLFFSFLLILVAVPMAFGCSCNKHASNKAFLKSVGQDQGYQTPDVQPTRDMQ